MGCRDPTVPAAWRDLPGVLRASFEQLLQAVATTDDCESLPAGLVHSDCHLGNVIESADGPILIDWAGGGRGPFVASLGWLLYTAAVQTRAASPGRSRRSSLVPSSTATSPDDTPHRRGGRGPS
jgi:Ser/Thr protein kinase RdoA (MazF antagonist)